MEKGTNVPDIQRSWSCMTDSEFKLLSKGKIPMLLFALSGNSLDGFDCRRAPPEKALGVRTRRNKSLWREAQICYRVNKQQESSKVGHFVNNWFLWRSRINYDLAKWFTKEISGVAVDVTDKTKNCHVLSRLVDVAMSRDVLFLSWVIQFRALFLTLTLCGHRKHFGFRRPNMTFDFVILHFWLHMAGHSRKQKIPSVDSLKNV